MKRVRIFLIMEYVFPIIIWVGVIWFFSAQPYLGAQAEFHDIFFILRKMVHVIEYGILALLIWRMIYALHFFHQPQNRVVVLIVAIIILAIIDEYHQTFVAGRCGHVTDILIDSVGVIGVAYLFLRRQK